MLIVPSGVGEVKLQEAGFMYDKEKSIWYHQGTGFGKSKAENEEKSVEKLVSYLKVGESPWNFVFCAKNSDTN